MIFVMIYGVLGASVSGMVRIYRKSDKKRIPDEILDSHRNLARPMVGAVSALAISMLLNAGLIPIENLGDYHVLVFSFIAGFSERFIETQIGKITQE